MSRAMPMMSLPTRREVMEAARPMTSEATRPGSVVAARLTRRPSRSIMYEASGMDSMREMAGVDAGTRNDCGTIGNELQIRMQV